MPGPPAGLGSDPDRPRVESPYPLDMSGPGVQRPPTPPPPSNRLITARYAIPGLVGTTLMAIGALGVGWLPPGSRLWGEAVIGALRASTPGAVFSRAAIFIGVALLLQAWLVLGHDVLDEVERSQKRLFAVMALWCLPLLAAPPLFSRDAYSYFAQGQLIIAGEDPYTTGVASLPGWFQWGADPLWAESPTPYGPLFLLLEHAVAATAGQLALLAAVLFRLLSVVGVALLALAVPRLADAHGIDPAKALWLAVLNPLIVMHFIAGAHNDALMVGLMVAGLWLASIRRPVVGVALIAAAGAVKPIALLVLPFAGLLWAGVDAGWRQRIWGWTRSLGIVILVFVLLSLAASVGLGWVGSLSTPGSVRTWLSPPTALGMTLGGFLKLLGLVSSTDGAVTVVRALAMLAGAAIGGYLVLRPEGRSPVRGAALALLAVVALGPVVQPWYLLWVLPLLAATGLTGLQLRITMLITTLLVLHGMTESNATADTLVDIRDGLATLAAVAMVALVLASSPGERRLLLGHPVDRGIRPSDAAARARAGSLVVRRPGFTTSPDIDPGAQDGNPT